MCKKFLVTLVVITLGSIGFAQTPHIVSISPAQNELDIPIYTAISVTFDIEMDAATINNSTFIVNARITGLHQGTISYDNITKTTTFDPISDFDVGEVVTVVLTTGIQSNQGISLDNSYVWSFTTNVMKSLGTFVLDSVYSVAGDPIGITSGDLNNDGYPDLVTSNRNFDNISVLLNNGDGTFAAKVDYGVGDGPEYVFAADMDIDGYLDLAVANRRSDNISVLFNNGDGTFAAHSVYYAGDGATWIFAADLDGDGDLDLASANALADNLSVLLNNGDGTFTFNDSYAIGDASSVFMADLDNDGDLDLLASTWIGGWVSVHMNNGDGTFAAPVFYNVSTNNTAYSVFAADYDRDNYLDISVVTGYEGLVHVLLNNGDGTFSSDSTYGVGIGAHGTFTGDLDGDIDLDLAIANESSDDISVLLNNGNGTFAPQSFYKTGDGPIAVITTDLDGDGDLDLANSNNVSGTVSVFMNTPPKNPTITNIADVPNDQGKQVRVSWFKNRFDGVASDSTVIEYSLWRRIDDLPSYLSARVDQESFDLKNNSSANPNNIFTLLSNQLPPGEWDFIRTIPAIGSNTYNVVAHTLADSTITHGMHWSAFSIVAHAANPLIFFISEPDSGYSLDNLIPHAPSGLFATAGDSTIALTWEMVPDEDFDYYVIYRHTESGFVPSEETLYGSTIDTLFIDEDVETGTTYYYKVAAIDFAGNQGTCSEEVQIDITGIEMISNRPTHYALNQNYPNPFNPGTTISFNLAKQGEVRIEIYNTLGQKVVQLLSENLSAGQYKYYWSANDMPSGIYYYTLQAGEFRETRRMLLLK